MKYKQLRKKNKIKYKKKKSIKKKQKGRGNAPSQNRVQDETYAYSSTPVIETWEYPDPLDTMENAGVSPTPPPLDINAIVSNFAAENPNMYNQYQTVLEPVYIPQNTVIDEIAETHGVSPLTLPNDEPDFPVLSRAYNRITRRYEGQSEDEAEIMSKTFSEFLKNAKYKEGEAPLYFGGKKKRKTGKKKRKTRKKRREVKHSKRI